MKVKNLVRLFVFSFMFHLALCPAGWSESSERTHWGADQSQLDRKSQKVLLKGNAYLVRDNEEIHADEIIFFQDTQVVHAKGRVRYQFGEYFVQADALELDLEKKTGVITNGNLSNGTFALRGSRMEQVGEDRYLVRDYDYTTCQDCPNSWEIAGKEVDFTIEGYAFIKDFMFKVKDASMFWLPYMMLPLKTKRQSGLLFPRFGVNQVYGLFYVQPAYLVLSDWADTTLGVGTFSRRGMRLEWEGRYAISQRSQGIANLFWIKDTEVPGLQYRYAGRMAVTQELPFEIEGKLLVNEVSDSGYPISYNEDVMGRFEPALSSDLFFSRNTTRASTVVSFRRIRNLLVFDQNNNNAFKANEDPLTVQEFPRVVVTTNDQFIWGSSFAAGVEARFNRFSRAAGPFDYFDQTGATSCPNGSTDPNCIGTVREAQRFTIIPNLYTTLTPWPWLSVVPNVQYRAYLYNFNNVYPNLARGYLLTQTELSVQLEKQFRTDDPNVSYKHTFRPTLTYSWIPTIQESSAHPFVSQVASQAQPGQYFDNSDIVPINSSQNLDTYFTPLGNSLTYGFTTQLFRRERSEDGELRVSRRLEARINQTLDITEANRILESGGRDQRIFLSPLFSQFLFETPEFSFSAEYTYYSFLDRYNNSKLLSTASPHRLSLGMNWTWERALKEGVLQFERSLGFNYTFNKLTNRVSSLGTRLNFSINDYIMPSVALIYNLVTSVPKSLVSSRYGMLFQSPSRCWRIEAAVVQAIDRGAGFGFDLNFALNLTGGSFGQGL